MIHIKKTSVIEELRGFEQAKEKALEKKQLGMDKRIAEEKSKLDKRVENEQIAFEARRNKVLKTTESDAMKQAKKLAVKYEQLKQGLRKSYTKNFRATVKQVFSELLK